MNIKLCVECKVPNYKSPTGKNKIHSTVHGKIVGSITRVFLNWKKNKKTFHILEVLNLLLSQIIKYELQIESFTIKLYSCTSYGLNLLLSNYIIRVTDCWDLAAGTRGYEPILEWISSRILKISTTAHVQLMLRCICFFCFFYPLAIMHMLFTPQITKVFIKILKRNNLT